MVIILKKTAAGKTLKPSVYNHYSAMRSSCLQKNKDTVERTISLSPRKTINCQCN